MKRTNSVKDLTGQRFGRLTAIEIDERGERGKTYWICECDCGNIKSVRSDLLTRGSTKSCGCIKRESDARNVSRNHKHKMSGTRIYHEWQNMKGRCYNENNARWERYGGRGIKVCDEWRKDFRPFYDWAMANGYDETLTLDRIDNDGDYCPENCRWATQKQQSRNRSSNVNITIGNSTRTLTEWCEIFDLDFGKIAARYKRNGDTSLEGLFNSRYAASPRKTA